MLVVFLPLLPLCILACAVALVRRFRRSEGVERLQLKWLATAGAAVVAFLYLCAMAVTGLRARERRSPAAGSLVVRCCRTPAILSFVLLPVAIGIAVLRHGLYGIDVVISRTLVYGALTGTLLAGCTSASVLLLQLVLAPSRQLGPRGRGIDPRRRGGLPAGATGSSRAVDRRFYRRRYDAARTVEAFASRLRHELDLDAVGATCGPPSTRRCSRRTCLCGSGRWRHDAPHGTAASRQGSSASTSCAPWLTLGAWATGPGSADGASVLLAVGFAVVGALVAFREPGNGVGWLLLAAGRRLRAAGTGRAGPRHLDAGRAAEFAGWYTNWAWLVWLSCAGILLPLVFPDGRLLSSTVAPRARPRPRRPGALRRRRRRSGRGGWTWGRT